MITNFQDAVCKCVYVDCVGFSDVFTICLQQIAEIKGEEEVYNAYECWWISLWYVWIGCKQRYVVFNVNRTNQHSS